jgi:prepilin-type processing-associated H-X9-DG protein
VYRFSGGVRAYTLIELLVILATVAVLAALLLPVVTKARERARQTQCASHLRQLGNAFQTYLADWDETFPPPLGNNTTWRSKVYPYLRTLGTYICPSNEAGILMVSKELVGETLVPFPTAYAMNGNAFNPQQQGDRDSWGRNIADIKDPSRLLLLTENRAFTPQLQTNLLLYSSSQAQSLRKLLSANNLIYQEGWGPLFSHQNGFANWLFTDGHVRWMKVRDTLYPLSLWEISPDTSLPLDALFPEYQR